MTLDLRRGDVVLVTIPRGEIVRRLGRFPPASLGRIGQALQDALGLVGGGGR